MSDINSAYDQTSNYESFESFNSNDYNNQQQQSPPQMQQQKQSDLEEERALKIRQMQQSSQMQQQSSQMQQSSQIPPPQMPLQRQQQKQTKEGFYNYGYQNRYPEYSFWDRMVMSKREVLKLFILSIVIILAISLEKFGSYYFNSYLTSTDLTTFQEFIVRLSFPVIVFLFLWIIKSL